MKWVLYGLAFIVSCFFAACKDRLSSEIQKSVFESGRFKEPISFDLPPESSKERYENIVNNPVIVDNSFLPRVTLYSSSTAIPYNQDHLLFLVTHRYIDIAKPSQRTINRFGEETKEFEFTFYTDKLRSSSQNIVGNKFQVAMRTLKNVTSVTSEQTVYSGTEVKIKQIKFLYTINSLLGNLSSPTKIFEGFAVVIKYPTSKNWDVKELLLDDSGVYEIIHANKNSVSETEANNKKIEKGNLLLTTSDTLNSSNSTRDGITTIEENIDTVEVKNDFLLPNTNYRKFFNIKKGMTYSEIQKIHTATSEFNGLTIPLQSHCRSDDVKLSPLKIGFYSDTPKELKDTPIRSMLFDIDINESALSKKQDIIDRLKKDLLNTLEMTLREEINHDGYVQFVCFNQQYSINLSYGHSSSPKNQLTMNIFFY